MGRCEGPAFESAGPHWNPTNAQHGLENRGFQGIDVKRMRRWRALDASAPTLDVEAGVDEPMTYRRILRPMGHEPPAKSVERPSPLPHPHDGSKLASLKDYVDALNDYRTDDGINTRSAGGRAMRRSTWRLVTSTSARWRAACTCSSCC